MKLSRKKYKTSTLSFYSTYLANPNPASDFNNRSNSSKGGLAVDEIRNRVNQYINVRRNITKTLKRLHKGPKPALAIKSPYFSHAPYVDHSHNNFLYCSQPRYSVAAKRYSTELSGDELRKSEAKKRGILLVKQLKDVAGPERPMTRAQTQGVTKERNKERFNRNLSSKESSRRNKRCASQQQRPKEVGSLIKLVGLQEPETMRSSIAKSEAKTRPKHKFRASVGYTKKSMEDIKQFIGKLMNYSIDKELKTLEERLNTYERSSSTKDKHRKKHVRFGNSLVVHS